MTVTHDDTTAPNPAAASSGLSPDELQAEHADHLPERDAMSIINLGGITGGLPPAEILDDVLDVGLPVEPLRAADLPDGPPEGLPTMPEPGTLPSLDVVDERIDASPIDTLLDGNQADAVAAETDADVGAAV